MKTDAFFKKKNKESNPGCCKRNVVKGHVVAPRVTAEGWRGRLRKWARMKLKAQPTSQQGTGPVRTLAASSVPEESIPCATSPVPDSTPAHAFLLQPQSLDLAASDHLLTLPLCISS